MEKNAGDMGRQAGQGVRDFICVSRFTFHALRHMHRVLLSTFRSQPLIFLHHRLQLTQRDGVNRVAIYANGWSPPLSMALMIASSVASMAAW